jgi:hypothetical protein
MTPKGKNMIKPWLFEFLYAPGVPGEDVSPDVATAVFDQGIAHWQHIERLGFEGIFSVNTISAFPTVRPPIY